MNVVNTRTDLLQLVQEEIGFHGRVAELGVFRGLFSAELIDILQPRTILLVDTWSGLVGCGDKDGQNVEVAQLEDVFDLLGATLRRGVCQDVRLCRTTTTEFLRDQLDRSLDFIYVDADHSYEGVLSDLTKSARVAKNLIAGHDYCDTFPGVKRAVHEFCATGWVMDTITLDGCPSYLLRSYILR